MKLESIFNLKAIICTVIVCFVIAPVKGQTKKKVKIKSSACTINAVNFQCPDGFTKVQNIGDAILFKQDNEGSVIYFFTAIPKQDFDDTSLRNIVAAGLSGKSADGFRWKDVSEPLMMNLETKFEKRIINRLGYNTKLINFVSRYFEFNGKTIVLGYAYDTDSDGLVKLFESGRAIGDNAVGCNAIATTLNSMTKEKRGKNQYCFIQGLSASE